MSNIVKFNAAELAQKLDAATEIGITTTEKSTFLQAFQRAEAIQTMRDLLTPEVMKPIMALQNSPLGFMTDRDPKQISKRTGKPNIPYDMETVRDCVIEGAINGVRPVNNEFNIVSGRCYIAKNGFGKKLSDIPGLRYVITPGVPKNAAGGSIQPMTIKYSVGSGKAETVILEICIRVNEGMGADAIIGKATRKARAWLYQAVTGTELPEGDADEQAIDITPKASPFESGATKEEKKAVAETDTVMTLEYLLHSAPVTAGQVRAYCPLESDTEIIGHLQQTVSAMLAEQDK